MSLLNRLDTNGLYDLKERHNKFCSFNVTMSPLTSPRNGFIISKLSRW